MSTHLDISLLTIEILLPEHQSLLRAVESSKAEVRDTSRSAQVEARLRTNISSLRDERDKALVELSDCRRKQSLLEEELRTTKANLSRITQEKISMERDSRAAIFLARSLDNNNSNDMNYYKRKVGELSDKLQSQQDLILKHNNTIVELRGQNELSTGEKRFRESYWLIRSVVVCLWAQNSIQLCVQKRLHYNCNSNFWCSSHSPLV